MIEQKSGYQEEYLGKPAIFSIPSLKLEDVEYEINNFLIENYGHAWSQTPNINGVWMGRPDGEYTKIEISFVGKEKIPALKRFLAQIAEKIGEECIYLLTGADSWYIYPPK
ncbi:MAG: hypothetical protein HYX20_01975 [Candidatus Yanofskybacteria bacterium]|nr:hypothetical protein [Candidatus Yanofskybacteria bacterium]